MMKVTLYLGAMSSSLNAVIQNRALSLVFLKIINIAK